MKLAKFLSIILGPQVFLPLLFFLLIKYGNFEIAYPNILVPLVFTLEVVIPLLGPFLADKLDLISDWDLPNRKDRYIFLVITIVSWSIGLQLIYQFGNQELFFLNLTLFILVLALSFITIFWKISFHVSIATISVVLINHLFSWQMPYIYLLVPLVAWARIRLGRHTIFQVLGGAIISLLILIPYAIMYP